MNTSKGISIVICCYNSELRLPRVLQAISDQKNCKVINWEVIVVNNNSKDNTYKVAESIFASAAFNNINHKTIDEPKPGLSAAREKGFNEAQYNYVLFCDDDNIMAPDFIADALQLIAQFPEADIFGAWCEGEFETPPPQWSKGMLTALAVGRPSKTSGFIQRPINGACMLVNKNAYTRIKNSSFQFLLTDRNGDLLTSGGDTELCYAMLLAGGKIYFSEKLFFYHLIPSIRLTKPYFKKLYLTPAKQDYVVMIYQWFEKQKEPKFKRFYFHLMINYCKTLLYCLKQWVITGNRFHHSLVFEQRLNYFIYCLFHPAKVKLDFNIIMNFSKCSKI